MHVSVLFNLNSFRYRLHKGNTNKKLNNDGVCSMLMASMEAPVVEAVSPGFSQSSEAVRFSSAVRGIRRLSPPSTLSPDVEPIYVCTGMQMSKGISSTSIPLLISWFNRNLACNL